MGSKKKGNKREQRASLLDGGELSHALQAALHQVFHKFDVDRDGALSTDELQAFARACNDGDCFSEEELQDLRFFKTTEQGWLTLKGFLQLYHTQTTARPVDTWADLKALGFDNALTLDSTGDGDELGVVALAPSAAMAATGGSTAAGTARGQCELSDGLYTQGRHDEALRAALAAVQLDGESAEAHRCAGRAFHALGRLEQAERCWQRASEVTAAAAPPVAAPSATVAPPVAAPPAAAASAANDDAALAPPATAAPSLAPAEAAPVEEEISPIEEVAAASPVAVVPTAALVVASSAAGAAPSADEPASFPVLVAAVNALHDARTQLDRSAEGTAEWAAAVLATHTAYGGAEAILGAEQPVLRSVRPPWLCGTPSAFESLADKVSALLPRTAASWALRGDACLLLPMGASIASEFYEKAEALASESGAAAAAAAYARQKDAAAAKFLASLDMAEASLAQQQGGTNK